MVKEKCAADGKASNLTFKIHWKVVSGNPDVRAANIFVRDGKIFVKTETDLLILFLKTKESTALVIFFRSSHFYFLVKRVFFSNESWSSENKARPKTVFKTVSLCLVLSGLRQRFCGMRVLREWNGFYPGDARLNYLKERVPWFYQSACFWLFQLWEMCRIAMQTPRCVLSTMTRE